MTSCVIRPLPRPAKGKVKAQAGASETLSGARVAPRGSPSRRSAGSRSRRVRRLPGERRDRPPTPPCRNAHTGSGHAEERGAVHASTPASNPCGPDGRGTARCSGTPAPGRPSAPAAPSGSRVLSPACTGRARPPRGQAKLGGEPPRLPPPSCVPRLAGVATRRALGQPDPAAPTTRHLRVRLRLRDTVAGGEVDVRLQPRPLLEAEHGPMMPRPRRKRNRPDALPARSRPLRDETPIAAT
jgi:hypothetical protein